MADFGIGEAAAVEGAKAAGEAAAAEGVLGGAEALGAAEGAEALGGFGSFAGAEGAAFAGPELAGAAGAAALPEAFGGLEVLGPGALGLATEAAPAAAGALGEAGAAALPAVESLPAVTPVGAGGAEIPGALGSIGETDAAITAAEGGSAAASSAETDAAIRAAEASAANVGPTSTAGGFGQGMLDAITKNPLTAGAIGLNAASAIGQQRRAGSIPAQLRDIAKPLSQTGQDLLAQYKAGKLNPADEFNINQWEHEQIAKAQSFYSRAGSPDSEAARNAIAKVRSQAQAMRDQALQGLLKGGLQAYGMGVGPLTSAVEATAAQDRQFQAAQSSALQSFLLLQALQSGRS